MGVRTGAVAGVGVLGAAAVLVLGAGVVVAMTQALAAASFLRLRIDFELDARDRSKVWHASPVTWRVKSTPLL